MVFIKKKSVRYNFGSWDNLFIKDLLKDNPNTSSIIKVNFSQERCGEALKKLNYLPLVLIFASLRLN